MAKLLQFPHHSNCDCCGRQASFKELAQRPSGYGPLKLPAMHKRPNTHHGTIQPLERQVSQRTGSANQRQKSLQHGSKSTQETYVPKTFDVLSGEKHNAKEIATEIEEAIVERSMLQATESRMKGTSCDKESLLEECLALKEALYNQLYHLQLHRIHHKTADFEQRKIEIAIQELEMAHGLQAPRTGDPSQLKARILGLKCRQQEYYNIMTIQQDDIAILKKDTRVSLTKEASMERDIFAGEIRRLQKMIRRLQVVYHKVCSENNELVRLRESIAKLQTKITKIELNIKNSKSIIEQMKKDIAQAKIDSINAQKNAKNAIIKAEELETHSLVLQNMLVREKEEAIRIQKQTSTLGEQSRLVKKENSDRAIQATLAAGMLASDAKKGKGGKHGGIKMKKLKEYEMDDSTLGSPKDLSAVRSLLSSPATPSSQQSTINKDFDKIRANYIKAIGKATNTFVETAPGSGSPGAQFHPDLGSPTGDHSKYEQLQETFVKDVSDAENTFMDMMDELEYSVARPRKDLEAEAKGLRAQLRALQKQEMDLINKWLTNLTIELDNKTLKRGEYVIDVTDSKTNVKITSPDKSPEALARKKAEEEALKKREAEEAVRRAAEEEARRKKIREEEAARRVAEEEARKKREAEEMAGRAAEEEARRKKISEEEVARRAAEEEAQKKREAEEMARRAAEEEATRKKISEEEAARRAAEEEAQKKREAEEMARRAAEEEARRKKISEEDAARRAAEEEEARRKKMNENEATRRAVEEEARRKKISEEEAARRAAEEEARKKREAEDEASRRTKSMEEDEATRKKRETDEEATRKKREAEEEAKRKKIAEDEAAARRKREAEASATTSQGKGQAQAAVDASAGDKKDEFFTKEMQGTIKENIEEVLSHLEVISESVQQKASPSGTVESAATDVLKKLDELPDQ